MKQWLVMICSWAIAALAGAAEPTAQDFALRLEVSAPAQAVAAPFLRVRLPAEVWLHTRSPELADLRMFNGAGEALSFAFTRPQTEAPEVSDIALPVYPIHEGAHRAALAGGYLQIRQSGALTTVVVDGAAADSAVNAPQNQKQVAAYLIDTRHIKAWVSALQMDVALEAGRWVPITVEASADLKTWRPLAQREPIFQLENEQQGDSTHSLKRVAFAAPMSIEGQYLRLTWADAEAGPLEVKGVTLKTSNAAHEQPAADTVLELGAPTARDRSQGADALEWTLPTPARITRIALRLEQTNTLIPINVFGRRRAGEPWIALGRGVVYRLNQDGVEHMAPALSIAADSYQALRLVAANSSSGWGEVPPRLNLHFEPREVVFLARSARPNEPYMLAVGRSQTSPAALPITTLMPAYQAKAEFDLPLAAVGAVTLNADLAAAPRVGPWGIELRNWILWGVLISAVLILSLFALSLVRRMKAVDPTAPTDSSS